MGFELQGGRVSDSEKVLGLEPTQVGLARRRDQEGGPEGAATSTLESSWESQQRNHSCGEEGIPGRWDVRQPCDYHGGLGSTGSGSHYAKGTLPGPEPGVLEAGEARTQKVAPADAVAQRVHAWGDRAWFPQDGHAPGRPVASAAVHGVGAGSLEERRWDRIGDPREPGLG